MEEEEDEEDVFNWDCPGVEYTLCGSTRRRRRRGGIGGSRSLPQDENGLTYLRIIRSIHASYSIVFSQDARQKHR